MGIDGAVVKVNGRLWKKGKNKSSWVIILAATREAVTRWAVSWKALPVLIIVPYIHIFSLPYLCDEHDINGNLQWQSAGQEAVSQLQLSKLRSVVFESCQNHISKQSTCGNIYVYIYV